MQSRLATKAIRPYRLLSGSNNNLACCRRRLATATRRTADPAAYSDELKVDPAVPSGKPEETKKLYEPNPAKKEIETEFKVDTGIEQPLGPPQPPYAPSTRLESTPIHNPSEPVKQQKHKNSTVPLPEDVSCVGFDGSPWPSDKERELEDEKQQMADNMEYYKHHKASPLLEIEVADTRKPIRRATDHVGPADEGGNVIGWRPEQLDTAEEALRRATEIWKQNAMRGDPTLPHSRVLRELRGEWF
ncbi:hypothetical protein CFOL_v3_00550 [Cephalotus follicularis]|uniref:Uncharacterized protein n=1 Tax=Cephalotus follicularis TaxID=3775 RepID=A0A1Q3AMN5_CEPFO|nr:hypothetical protein CFOL_v3_00550 [Cephalotus follicularis]